jgi:hypothetical protein
MENTLIETGCIIRGEHSLPKPGSDGLTGKSMCRKEPADSDCGLGWVDNETSKAWIGGLLGIINSQDEHRLLHDLEELEYPFPSSSTSMKGGDD